MKNLILDPLQHFPTLYKILGEEKVDYYAITTFQPTKEEVEKYSPYNNIFQIYGNESDFNSRYGFIPKSLAHVENEEYDNLFFVFSPWDFEPNISGDRHIFLRNYAKNMYNKFKDRVKGKIIFIDNSDCALDPTPLLSDFKYDFILKREYFGKFKYDNKIISFPFVMFGRLDALWILLYMRRKGLQGSDGCFWAGSVFNHIQPEYGIECRRADFYHKISPILSNHSGLDLNNFLSTINNHKFFLNLKGVGNLCRRMFEGLAQGSLMMSEKMDLVFPFEEGENFHDNCFFETVQKFPQALEKLRTNKELYTEALTIQEKIVDKYFNESWLKNYIFEKTLK